MSGLTVGPFVFWSFDASLPLGTLHPRSVTLIVAGDRHVAGDVCQ